MGKYFYCIGVFFILFVVAITGCSSSSSSSQSSSSPQENNPGGEETTVFEDLLASQGLELIDSVDINGDIGYLAVYIDKKSSGINAWGEVIEPFDKYCLILTGSPYSIGYQTGYLLPEYTHRMATEFIDNIIFDELKLLGIDIPPDSPAARALFNLLYKKLAEKCWEAQAKYIPEYLWQEMQGVADGASDAGCEVTDENVLVINQAIDALLSILASLLLPQTTADAMDMTDDFQQLLDTYPELEGRILINNGKILFPGATGSPFPKFGCNEFVVDGRATGGDVYHGRDFMFATASVYQDVTCMMVYLPDEGNPFVAVSPPGFVGKVTGMNDKGLSMAQDVSIGSACNADPGPSSMLIIRDIVQHCDTLEDGIQTFRSFPRGTPWVYFMVDDEEDEIYGHGAALEVGRSAPGFSGPDLLPDWEYWLFSGLPIEIGGEVYHLGVDLIERLSRFDEEELNDEGVIESGAMIRSSKWIFPSEFSNLNISLPVPNPFFPLSQRFDLANPFPNQNETSPDILVAANHYIIPRMRLTQLDPLIAFGYWLEPFPESIWRYETLLDLILQYYERIVFFGPDPDAPVGPHEIDDREYVSAGWLIDFLNPNGRSTFYIDKGKPLNGEVEGHHAVMNNTTREFRALYGYYQDPWVGVKLMPFVEWYYEAD